MKFAYSYRTKENLRAEDAIEASSREAAFASLRERGIRPMKLWTVDAPVRPRRVVVPILIPLVAVAALAAGVFFLRLFQPQIFKSSDPQIPSSLVSARHQIYGDPALLADLTRRDFVTVFSEPIDRHLARYALPGLILKTAPQPADALALPVGPIIDAPDDPREIRELKAIVRGLRAELADFVSAGGTVARYLELLDRRQHLEAESYAKLLAELNAAAETLSTDALYDRWQSANDTLRAMGLRTIPLPEALLEKD